MDSTIFIGSLIIAVTQAIKYVAPKVSGLVTIGVAVCVGIVTALLSTPIGLGHITVAEGILTALAAVGVHVVVTNTSPPKV